MINESKHLPIYWTAVVPVLIHDNTVINVVILLSLIRL